MYPCFESDPRRGGGSDLSQWMLALVALVFLSAKVMVLAQLLRP